MCSINPVTVVERPKPICLLKIGLFICLDHELVHDHDVGIRNPLQRLQAETRRMPPLFDHSHKPWTPWHAVGALLITGALDIDVAEPRELAVLFDGQRGAE